jgi:tRNA pseudouridine55 synthase
MISYKQIKPSGFLLIDKPSGWTSFDVVAKLRVITKIKKIGHCGTLDPLATGLLIIAIGRLATKRLGKLQKQTKVYKVDFELGKTADTYDVTGAICQQSVDQWPTIKVLTSVLNKFIGPQEQVPPMYSAKKINGQKLYNLARQGKVINRPAQKIVIYNLEIIDYKPPMLSLIITCSAGTYVRSFGHDLGLALNTGAIMTALQRLAIGDQLLKDAQPLCKINQDNWQDFLFTF